MLDLTLADVLRVGLATATLYAAVLGLTRLAGLRSLAKMSGFDVAMTIALGSVVAAAAVGQPPTLGRGLLVLAVLYALQAGVSLLRRTVSGAQRAVDNRPVLLVARGRVLHDHLARVRLTMDDLHGHLRLAGVAHLDDVYAVVFETTGDVAVIRADRPADPRLFDGVAGAHLLHSQEPDSPADRAGEAPPSLEA